MLQSPAYLTSRGLHVSGAALQIIQELSVSNELLEVSELCRTGCVQTDYGDPVSEHACMHAHCSKGSGTSLWNSPHVPLYISI